MTDSARNPFLLARSLLHVAIGCASMFWVVAGCDATILDIEDCALRCDDICPTGSHCAHGYCVRDGSDATCTSEEAGVSDSKGTGGASGGTASGGAPSSGGAQTPNGGGMPAIDAGTGGRDDGREHALAIRAPSVPSLCAGQTTTLDLTATGGMPPYVWSIVGTPFAQEISGTRVEVTATAPSAGDYTVEVTVTDGTHTTANSDVTVHVADTPQITTATLPPGCAGQPYGIELAAKGGNGSPYQWTLDTNTSPLVLDGASLVAPTMDTGETSLTVTVTDGTCTSDKRPLKLKVDHADQCPQFLTKTLPAPCRANPYGAQFVDFVGKGDPRISAASLPPGLAFDPTTRMVSGVGSSDDPLVLQVEDNAGHVVRQTYPMTARDTCWLAYLSTVNGPTQLHLFDPVLDTRIDVPRAPTSDAVLDYKFSPDGRHLAYRLGASNGPAHLRLLTAPTWNEQAIELDGDVQHYEWSPSSKTLAVSYQRADTVYLGGVTALDVPASVPPESDGGTDADGGVPQGGTPDASTAGVQLLDPLVAPVGSEMVWFGEQAVEFHAGELDEQFIHYATMGARGFDRVGSVGSNAPYVENLVLRVSRAAVIVVEPTYDIVPYPGFDGLGPPATFDAPTSVLDPQGRYVGITNADSLGLFTTNPPRAGTPWARATGCTMLLSWASHQQRLACLGKGSSGESVVFILNVDEATASIESSQLNGDYDYRQGDALSRRRTFSESGNWFAFTTTQSVYVAKLSEGPPFLFPQDRPGLGPYSGPTELAFSPNDHWLLSQRGTSVTLHDLTDMGSVPKFFGSYRPPAANDCSDDFLSSPLTWCGNVRAQPWFVWSSDSSAFAGKTAGSSIETWNIIDATVSHSAVACAAGCSDDFIFQPLAAAAIH